MARPLAIAAIVAGVLVLDFVLFFAVRAYEGPFLQLSDGDEPGGTDAI